MTLTEPSADQQVAQMYNRGMSAAEQIVLVTGTRYVLALVEISPKGKRQGDEQVLAAVERTPGVAATTFLIEHETRETLPEGKCLVAVVEVKVRIEDVPEE